MQSLTIINSFGKWTRDCDKPGDIDNVYNPGSVSITTLVNTALLSDAQVLQCFPRISCIICLIYINRPGTWYCDLFFICHTTQYIICTPDSN